MATLVILYTRWLVFVAIFILIGAQILQLNTMMMNSSDNEIHMLAPAYDNATVAAKTVNNVTNATVPSNNTITNTTIVTKPIILPSVNGTFFFIHIGKTAGTSIRGTLRPLCHAMLNPNSLKKCLLSFYNKQETILSQRTLAAKHCDIILPQMNNVGARVDNFVVSLRDPMDRFVSAFFMGTPRNGRGCGVHTKEVEAFYCQCFEYVGDFLNAFAYDGAGSRRVADNDQTTNTTAINAITVANNTMASSQLVHLPPANITTRYCKNMAKKVIKNPPSWTSHMAAYNYQFYNNFLSKYPTKPIFAVRTEHLWNDLQQLEYMFGGNATVNSNLYESTTHGSEKYRYKKELTVEETQILCCLIIEEVEIYVKLIQRAINLNDVQRNESLHALDERCDRDLCYDTRGKVRDFSNGVYMI